MVDIDLTTFESTEVGAAAELSIERPGQVEAILLTFSADLADDVRLVHRPRTGEQSSWEASVWFLPDPLAVDQDSRLHIDYRYGVAGETDGLTCIRVPGTGNA